ncbi:MAG: RodZ domain-containing protein [Anaerolineae bacterium]
MPQEPNATPTPTETLGQRLRKAREARNLSLDAVEEATRIRRQYLEALEADQYDALPGAVFLRGFVRNYALFLGLNPEEMLALLPAQPTPVAPETARRRPPQGDYSLMDVPLQPAPSWFNVDVVVGVLLIVALVAFIGWVVYRQYLGPYIQARPAPTATPTVTEAVPSSPTPLATAPVAVATEQPTAAPQATSSPTPGGTPTVTSTPSATPVPTATPTPVAPIEVTLIAEGRSWVEVVADGERVFRGFLVQGDEKTFYADERLQVHLGNAGVVRVVVNGEDMGYLGAEGEVVHKEFLVEGAPTSTPTFTPAPTATPTPAPQTEASPEASPTGTPTG